MNIFRNSIIFFLILLIIHPVSAMSLALNSSWHIQFSGTQKYPTRDIFNVDLFDTSKAVIQKIQTKWSKVICYISAGTREDWRPDVQKFPASTLGNTVDGWKWENWIDVRNTTVQKIMQSRMDLAKSKWCDGIDPDNVNGHENNTGFQLSSSDMIAYNQFLVTEAHKRWLLIGLKNAQSLISSIGKDYDFFINESCYTYNECGAYISMISLWKPVIIMEYTGIRKSWCRQAKSSWFVLQYFNLDLSGTSRVCTY